MDLCGTINCKGKDTGLGSESPGPVDCWGSATGLFLCSFPEHLLLDVTGDLVLANRDLWCDQNYCFSVFV